MSISVSIYKLYGMWFKTNWIRWNHPVEDLWRELPNSLTKRLYSISDSKISRQFAMIGNTKNFKYKGED